MVIRSLNNLEISLHNLYHAELIEKYGLLHEHDT